MDIRDFILGFGAGKAAGGGGGGSSGFELIYENTLDVETTSTSAEDLATVMSAHTIVKGEAYYYAIYDLNGVKSGYFYGNEGFILAVAPTGVNPTITNFNTRIRHNGSALVVAGAAGNTYGVYIDMSSATATRGLMRVVSRYSSANSGTISGRFKVAVYKMSLPVYIEP